MYIYVSHEQTLLILYSCCEIITYTYMQMLYCLLEEVSVCFHMNMSHLDLGKVYLLGPGNDVS